MLTHKILAALEGKGKALVVALIVVISFAALAKSHVEIEFRNKDLMFRLSISSQAKTP